VIGLSIMLHRTHHSRIWWLAALLVVALAAIVSAALAFRWLTTGG
jgi:hypothetical protein